MFGSLVRITAPAVGVLLVVGLGGIFAHAADYIVRDQKAYKAAVKKAEPGDQIILANGQWADFQIVFEAEGRADAPITLRAETPGGVFITGQSNLRIGGKHLVVRGLTFRDGASPTKEVVSFRRDSKTLAHHVRFTENVIERFNKAARSQQDSWVVLFGQNNRVDHNAFVGKTNKGPTMIVRLNTEESQQNNHLIENNYFGGRPPLGGNGGETLRIGVSQTSRTTSATVVRNNYFEKCDGEVEIISIKSEGNLITENMFYESRGSVVFRHGGGNRVTRNVFLGGGVPDTGGIRVINDNQTVTDNYLEGVRGEKFLGALVVMNGVPNSPENRYHQVDNAVIANNSFIDVGHIGLGVGSDDERSAVPINSRVTNNVFHSSAQKPLGIFDDMSGIDFRGNVSNHPDFQSVEATLAREMAPERGANGLLQIGADAQSDVGAPADLEPLQRDDTGPSYFLKPDQSENAPNVIEISASEKALKKAISEAASGVAIKLPKKRIKLSSPITIDRQVKIIGTLGLANRKKSVLISSQQGLFVIEAGGELDLQGVILEQTSSETALVHAAGDRYFGDYSLAMADVTVQAKRGLDAVGPLLTADPETFASSIKISSLKISGWPGSVINLSGEGLDGWYLSDFVSIRNSQFSDIDGPLVRFGREGRDESTFGPKFNFVGSSLADVGHDLHSIELAGIDGLNISENSIDRSGDVIVRRRVLGFPFGIEGNSHDGSASLVVQGVDGEPLLFDFVEGAL